LTSQKREKLTSQKQQINKQKIPPKAKSKIKKEKRQGKKRVKVKYVCPSLPLKREKGTNRKKIKRKIKKE
jgi:hypothetical protein